MKRRQCRLRSTSSTDNGDRGSERVQREMEGVLLRLNALMLRARMNAHARSHSWHKTCAAESEDFCITHVPVLLLVLVYLPYLSFYLQESRLCPTVTRGCDTRLDVGKTIEDRLGSIIRDLRWPCSVGRWGHHFRICVSTI